MSVSKKQASKTSFSIKNALIVFGLILPIIGVSFAFGSAFSYLGALNNYFVNEVEIDTSEFVSPDAEFMENAAENWSRINDIYCTPKNLTGDGWDYYPATSLRYSINPISQGIHNESELLSSCDILDANDPMNEIHTYEDTGHSAAYSAIGMMGEALRYAVYERNGEAGKKEQVSDTLLNMVKAYSLLSDIDPEGRMARYAIPDTPSGRNAFKYFSYSEDYAGKHLIYNQTYVASNGKEYTYWLETGTSVDLYIAILYALGMTYAFVNNATIRANLRVTVDRMLEYFEKTGWRFTDLDGKSHCVGSEAVNTKPIADTSYCLAFLLVGKTVHPERWTSPYNNYARNRLYAKKVGKQSQLGVHSMFTWADGYFNINLMMMIASCLATFETDPSLAVYYRKYLNKVYSIVRNHRNGWFDGLYALGMSNLNFDDYDQYILPPSTRLERSVYEYIEADVADCMMRCAYTKKTGRRFMNPTSNSSYDAYNYLSPIPGAKYPDVQYFDWTNIVDLKNPIMKLFSDLYSPDHAWTHSEGIWDRPIPADWRRTTNLMWEYSPFDTMLNTGYTGVQQMPNGDFIGPYWLARYLNFSRFAP